MFCECDKYSGCENKFFQKNNCLVCQFYLNFSIEDDLEPVKFYPLEQKELYEKIQKELDEVRKVFYCEFWVMEVVSCGKCRDGYYVSILSDFTDKLFLARGAFLII